MAAATTQSVKGEASREGTEASTPDPHLLRIYQGQVGEPVERGKLIGDQRILTRAVDEWLVAALLCAMMMAMRRLHRAENFDLYYHRCLT